MSRSSKRRVSEWAVLLCLINVTYHMGFVIYCTRVCFIGVRSLNDCRYKWLIPPVEDFHSMASFMIQLSKSLFVIIVNSKASCLHHECEPCPSYVFSFLEPSLFYLPCAFIRASSFDCSPAFGASLGPPGLPRLLSFVSGELSVHQHPKPCEELPRGAGAQQWPGAGETFAAREGPPFPHPYNGKEKWFMSEYGHIILIKPTQKRQHCNIFQWLFIMNYVSLSLNCYYFSLMLLGACIIYSIGSCGTMK